LEPRRAAPSCFRKATEDNMRGALLWFLGIPIPVIILLYLFHVI
jgi:hypothetical protein